MSDRSIGWLTLAFLICAAALAGGLVVSERPTIADLAVEAIMRDEGFRPIPYIDTRGYMTVGYGTRLPITRDEAALLLRVRMDADTRQLAAAWPSFADQPDGVRLALTDMAYQLGVHGVTEFRDMLGHLEAGDCEAAADAALDSKWARETPNRAARVAALMRKC